VPSAKTLANLPSDPEALKALLSSLLLERDEQKQRADEQQRRAAAESSLRQSLELKIEQLQHELEWLKKRYYGPRADRLRSIEELGQLLLEFSEELARKPVNAADVATDAKPTESERELRWIRPRKGRRNLAAFENLPVQTVVHELSLEERACSNCGAERQEIGSETSWQIEYIPAHFERIKHVRKKYACSHCDHEGVGAQIAVAEKPATPIEKGMAGPGLLAYIVTSKFADFLPLYRLENIFERIGCEISRSTLSVWCGDVADLIAPLYERMATRVRQSHVVLTDDTPMPMLEPGRGKTRRARMWVYLGDESQPYNVFHFTQSRKRDGPLEFLRDYHEVLVADGYGGYDGVVAGTAIRRGGCHAHARRKFVDAEKTAPEIAREAVELYRALYKIEKDAAALDATSRLVSRREHSRPLLEDWHERLRTLRETLLPKNPMAEAVTYSLNQWKELALFLEDGAVPIDNNASEREMKRVVLNRKNSLFVGNARGGRTAAILSSFTATCRRHEIDPQFYLTQLLVNLPTWPMNDLDAWLPDRWKLRQLSPPQPCSPE
jgi:transposase